MKDQLINLKSITFLYDNGTKLILEEEKNPGIGTAFYKNLVKKVPTLSWVVKKGSTRNNPFGFITNFFKV